MTMRSAKILVAVLFLVATLLVSQSTTLADSCHWVSGKNGDAYTDYVSDVWYKHRVLWIWNGDRQPNVQVVYYWVDTHGWIRFESSDNTIQYGFQQHQSGGWYGYNLKTTMTLVNEWFNGSEGYWDDDWRWAAYICS